MKKHTIIGIIIAVLIVLILVVVLIFFGGKEKPVEPSAIPSEDVITSEDIPSPSPDPSEEPSEEPSAEPSIAAPSYMDVEVKIAGTNTSIELVYDENAFEYTPTASGDAVSEIILSDITNEANFMSIKIYGGTSGDELAPGFMEGLIDYRSIEFDAVNNIAQTGEGGEYIIATDGTITLEAYLYDVYGGVLAIVFGYDDSPDALYEIYETLQINE